jgi:formylglycine-generating enzyme required for sulfatase activity
VNRGGGWNNNAINARCSHRNNNTPTNTNNNIGFRTARSSDPQRRMAEAEARGD